MARLREGRRRGLWESGANSPAKQGTRFRPFVQSPEALMAGELQGHGYRKGTEEIDEENLSILLCFLAAISSVPLPAATSQFPWP